MKKILIGMLALSAITFSATAQEQRATKERKEYKKDGMRHDRMQDLNLTEAQKTQVKTHRESMKTQADAIKNNNSLTQEQKKQQFMALRTSEKAYMESILTAEQKAKLAEAKANRPAGAEGMKEDGMRNHEGHMGKNDMKQNMQQELNLSNDQAAKLKAINMESRDKMAALKSNTSLSDADRKTQIKSIKDQAKTQREAVLTKDQVEKMKTMKKDHKGMKGHGDKKAKK